MAFLYCGLIIYAIFKDNKYLLKTFLASILTIIGYLPWITIFLNTFNTSLKYFWLTFIPEVKTCVEYIFSSNNSIILFSILCVATFVYCAYKTKILYISKKNKKINIDIDFSKYESETTVFWILTGIISIVGTIFVGITISKILRPLFLIKYMYPVTIIAWLILSITIPKLYYKKVYVIITLIIILLGTIPNYLNIYIQDRKSNIMLQNTLEKTVEIDSENDIIITDIEDIYGRTGKYYYPKARIKFIDDKRLDLDDSKEYWFMISKKIDNGYISKIKGNYEFMSIIENGNIGTNPVFIYKLQKNNENQ